MSWQLSDTWILITATSVGMACVLPGVFLLLSRQSMMAHGIAHSVLPGIVIAHLISGGVETPALMVGAVLAGILCAVLTRFLQNFSGVEAGAALGIAFTTLFAVGLIMQRLLADHVHIEPSHVFFGNLESAAWGRVFPEAAARGLLSLAINTIFVVALFKELTICTFDPNHGNTVGARPRITYYLLMAISAVTCVIAFEAVGSILVVAMIIIPPAIGSLFTKDLKTLIYLSLVIALICSLLGYLLSRGFFGNSIATVLGFERVGSTTVAGGIAVVAGLLFIISAIIRKFARKPEPITT